MKKRIIALLMAVLMLCSMLAACGPNDGGAAEGGAAAEGGEVKDTLVVALPAAPTHMDPMVQATIATFRVTTQMFDRLVMFDTDMQLQPALAESWEVIDETTTKFNLRQGVKFHNGEEMTSEDVKYSLERCIASPGVNYNYLIIDSITCDDKYTVTIKTKEPFNALLPRLALEAASIICKSADTDPEEFNRNPVGAGPYKFKSWELGGDVVLEAHDEYWGGTPKTKTIVFRTIPEAINRSIGLETGEVDLAFDLGITDLQALEGNENVTTMTKPGNTIWYLGMNTTKAPFDNAKVRQAIAYATKPQDYIDIVFSGVASSAHNTMLPSGVAGYAPDTVTYDFDTEKAKALLAEAGYPDGFSITLTCSDNQVMRDSAVVLQEQLRQIGITAEIKTMEQSQYTAACGNGEHEMFVGSKTSMDPDSMLRALYHTDAFGPSGNYSFWATPETDAMINEASTTTDTARVEELYKEVQTIVATECPLIPLAAEHLTAGMQSNVKGFDIFAGKAHFINGTYFE